MNKKQYRELCAANTIVPIFSNSFWLDAVSESWEVAAYSEKGKLFGVLPYSLKGNVLTKRIYIPELTAYSGPVLFSPENLSEYDKRSFEKKVLTNLLYQLPDKLYKSSIKCYPAIDNWLPFHWKGYKQTNRYTYLLDTSKSREQLFGNFKESHQRQIRKAEKANVQIEQCADVPMLFTLFSKTFERQGMKTPFSRAHFEKIYAAVKQNQSGDIFIAQNKSGKLLAAIFVVWDAASMYYLLGYFDEQEANSGAMTFLFWYGIQLAKTKNIVFNFEGSMLEGIEQYFRGFGGKLSPVHFISK